MEKTETNVRRQGFNIDDYVILFPESGEFIKETEDGQLSIIVDIYKQMDNNMIKVTEEEVTDDLHEKIEEYINRLIYSAIEIEKE
jgi:hypothetical protein